MKSTHRQAARAKRQTLPKFWRPALSADVKLDAKVTHWDLLNRISSAPSSACGAASKARTRFDSGAAIGSGR